MLKAIILDFNGVILNDELLHFAAMREVAAGFGIDLKREAYWEKYLPLDDAHCLQAICRDYSIRLDAEESANALARKASLYRQSLRNSFPLFPGAARFVRTAARHYPLALASGARRDEIDPALDSAGLRDCLKVIVAAENFAQGKPHPESFLLALERLNAAIDGPSIRPEECLVIEDSVGGIEGAKAAGMACMAVANSYPKERLKAADWVVASLEDVPADGLQALFEQRV